MIMPRILLLTSLMLALTACAAPGTSSQPIPPADTHTIARDRILILFYDDSVGVASLLHAVNAYPATLVHHYTMLHGMAIAIPADRDVSEAIAHFRALPGVTSVGRNQTHYLHAR